MAKHTVTLTDNATGKQLELEVLQPTMGPPVIDIGRLYKDMGFFTFDPGFVSTASCESAITYMDGKEGILAYRGYPIEQLAEHSTYLETCYLLFYGDLPTPEQLEQYRRTICSNSVVHEEIKRFYRGFRQDAHPMAIMMGVVGAMSALYHGKLDIFDREDREKVAACLIAKMPTIAAWSYRYAHGLPLNHPDSSLGYAENFLYMMFAMPTEPFRVDPRHAKALDLIMILHADHEQNASTSTVRLAGSSAASPFASVAAGIGTLWGPAHGGANEAVINMIREIIASGKPLEHYIGRAKDKNDPFRLMGFGHRVYKTYDPRARIIRKICHEILADYEGDDEIRQILDVAMQLEEVALNDEYFISRNLYPNVDFYSGIIFLALGIPLNMFTVVFAMARTIGWISQWNEMLEDPLFRIGRPRQRYIGVPLRDYPAERAE